MHRCLTRPSLDFGQAGLCGSPMKASDPYFLICPRISPEGQVGEWTLA